MLLPTSKFALVWFLLQHKLTRCQMNIVTPFWCQAKHSKFLRTGPRSAAQRNWMWRISQAQLLLGHRKSASWPRSGGNVSTLGDSRVSWCQWPRDVVVTSARRSLSPTQRMHRKESSLSAVGFLHIALPGFGKSSTPRLPWVHRTAEWKSENCQNANHGKKKKITRSRWDKMDIFHLSWETLQYIICDASHTQPWPFTNKQDRGICHEIINRVGHKLDGAELLEVHTRLSLNHRVLGATVCASGCPPTGISAHPTGQDPSGSIHRDETQRFFTPKKPWVTLIPPRLTLGDHVYGAGFLSF